MNITTLIGPPVEPVTLAEIWDQLRLNPDLDSPPSHPDDAMLAELITEAREDCEKRTRRAFVKQKLRLSIDPRTRDWPFTSVRSWGGFGCHRGVELQRPPVAEIVQVAYFNSANVLTVLDPSTYFMSDDEPARLHFVNGFSVLDAYPRGDALRIDYWAGYAWDDSPSDLTSNVPAPIKGAIKLGVQKRYDSMSSGQLADLERTVKAQLATYVVQIAI